jgi:hypothetical protein
MFPMPNQFPTLMFPKTFVDKNTPVNEPTGANNRSNPSSPSLRCILSFIKGSAAAQTPIIRLEVEKRKPSEATGFILKN